MDSFYLNLKVTAITALIMFIMYVVTLIYRDKL